MIKITVKHGGRELTVEAELPQAYAGCADQVHDKRLEAHNRCIKDVVQHVVEQVIKMNQ
jgi:hypothetical protein